MTLQVCGRCDTPLFLTESRRDGFCDDHRGNTPAIGEGCDVYGCKVGEHSPDELRAIPLPGEQVYHRTVIASVYYTDEEATLLLLASKSMRDPEFRYRYNYEVARLALRPHGNLTILSEHLNIVPAVREYEQEGGDY